MEAPNTPDPTDRQVSRQTVLRAALAVGVGVALPVGLVSATPALARTASATPPLTPMCDDGDDPTPPQMEGPYFTPNSPQRTSLVEPGMPGTRLTITGFVFGLSCQPLANVLLDFWQCDAGGIYDNTGYRLRGHQFTNAQGAYSLSTIVPGLYPGRTRHVHVKVQAPGRPILTTQLYFPGEPGNGSDPIYDPRLLMTVRTVGDARAAEFDYVLNVPGSTDPPGDGTWAEGTSYAAGDRVTYAGRDYVCLQAHTALPGWEPPSAPALWRAA
ncbi:dioxygenase [Actinophytocola xinjiangensis]|uniref:Dioxygenase n=1 Tax=Actinophytocola xinjiangensis TaxID=485602 RepID=A0A7Z0WSG2_9PSEU|nr:carbohydrate-binding protein [Actinophytocola xinjiangensis]OLF13934.1 dioxygenase [Actinophytocola xinjiangensis]